jgi:hypothetical protein
MQQSLRGLALRGAFGALMIGAGLMGAPAFAASGHGHEQGRNTAALNGHAKLEHTPTGTASLKWDHTTKHLTVDLSLTGLTPGAAYTANLEQGRCDKASSATLVDTLTGITADATGKGTSSTSLTDSKVANGIPHEGHQGWYVAVNQGTTMVACGNVRDMHHEGDKGHKGHESHKGQQTQQASDETAKAKLGPTKDANQRVHGEAHLQLKNGTLTVKMNVHGLTEGATYPAEIDQGSCSALSSTQVYPLSPLTQNTEGDWTSTTTEKPVTTIPDGQWYVAIWSAGHSNLLACGNVRVGDND